MRRQLIASYLRDTTVYSLIGHDRLTYAKEVVVGLVAWTIAWLLFLVLSNSRIRGWRTVIFGIIGAGIYIRTLYALLDNYLDVMVIADLGLIMLQWDGFFSYQTTIIQWISIERVSEQQHSFVDTLLKSGDIAIKVEDELFSFSNVAHPTETVSSLLHWKQKILQRSIVHEVATPQPIQKEKYDLLVEALGEVVSEYVDKKNLGS